MGANDLILAGKVDESDNNYTDLPIAGLKLDTDYSAFLRWIFASKELNDKVSKDWSTGFKFHTEAYVSSLVTPVITVTAESLGYLVAYPTQTSKFFEHISIEENVSNSSTAPSPTDPGWVVKVISADNPVRVSTGVSVQKRWVRARLVDKIQGITAYSEPKSVTPIDPTSAGIDKTPPDELTIVSSVWSSGNIKITYTEPTDTAKRGVKAAVYLTVGLVEKPFYFDLPGSGEFIIKPEDIRIAFGSVPSGSITGKVCSGDGNGNYTTGVAITIGAKPNILSGQTPTFSLSSSLKGYIVTSQLLNDATKINVYASKTSGFTPGPSNLVYSGNSPAFIDDTTYTLNYVRVSQSGEYSVDISSIAAEQSITAISPDLSDTIPPQPPSNFTGSGFVDSTRPSGETAYITFSWTASPSTDVKAHLIRFGRTSGTLDTVATFGSGTTARLDNLSTSTDYYFQIAANDGTNDSTWIPATPLKITTPKDTTAPASVSNLGASTSFSSIIAYWDRNTESDVDLGRGTYNVKLSTTSTFNVGTIVYDKVVTATVVTISGLTTGTNYYLRVNAIDSSGNAGPFSQYLSALTPGKIVAGQIGTGAINASDIIVSDTIIGTHILAGDVDADRLKTNTGIVGKLYLGDDAGTAKITLDGTATDPAIYIGTGAFNNTNTPVYLASVGSVGKFSLGNKLSWDGSNLSVNGSVNISGASTISSSLGITGAPASSYLYAGASASANERVVLNQNGLFGYAGGSQVFSIDSTGANLASGTIANWKVSSSYIQNTLLAGQTNYTGMSATGTYAFWAGSSTQGGDANAAFYVKPDGSTQIKKITIVGDSSSPTTDLINAGGVFKVTNAGAVTITGSADITGKIKATSGEISGTLGIKSGGSLDIGTFDSNGNLLTTSGRIQISSGGISAYAANSATPTFSISATNGAVAFGSGSIAGWTFNDSSFTSPGNSGSGQGPISINSTSNKIVFNSGQTGAFKIDSDDSSYSITTYTVNYDVGDTDDVYISRKYFTPSVTAVTTTGYTKQISIKRDGVTDTSKFYPKLTLSAGDSTSTPNQESHITISNLSSTGLKSSVQVTAGTVIIDGDAGIVLNPIKPSAPRYTYAGANTYPYTAEMGATVLIKSDGTLTTGRGFFTSTGTEASITNPTGTFSGVGLNGDIIFSTGN